MIYNIGEVREMEQAIVSFGFILFCIFFLIGFCIGNGWLLGCIPALIIILFGWFFWDE
jgi:hypothetical protein